MRAPALIVSAIVAFAGLPAAPAIAQGPTPADSLIPSQVPAPVSEDTRPPGFKLSSLDAARIADRSPTVRGERAKRPGLERRAFIPTYRTGPVRWQVTYVIGDKAYAEVHVHGRTGRVLETWTEPQADWIIARGYQPSIGGKTFNAAYVILPLCLLFLAPFFDPRRPFRLLHFDLLAVLGFGVSLIFFNRGEVDISVPLVYPFLGYLLVRLLMAGFRPRKPNGPLVPVMPIKLLAVGLVLLIAFRVALNVVDSSVLDIGYASVIGADRILHGLELYTDNAIHGDTYGPMNYVAYIPFELVFPHTGSWDDVAAARAAALTFDLLTMLGLFLLGRRLRRGGEGTALGIALAFAWAACPFSTYVLQSNTNDGLVAMLLVFALLAVRSAPARGALLGLGAAAKFVPLVLAPLFAAGLGDRRPRTVGRFAALLVLVCVAAVLAYLPDGGFREFWNATLGHQLSRESPFSLYGLYPVLEPLRFVLMAMAVGLAAACFFVPRERDLCQVAALGGAVMIATQLAATHWLYFYVVWFAPFALVALLGAHEKVADRGRVAASRRPERDPVAAGALG